MRSRQREVSQAVGDADMEGALHHDSLPFVVLGSVGVWLSCRLHPLDASPLVLYDLFG